MPRFYYDLQTNITKLNEGICPPCLDKAIFKTKDGTFLEVEGLGEDNFGLDNGVLSGVVKGDISYSHSVDLVNTIDGAEWITADERFIELLDGAELIGYRIDEERLSEDHGYPDDFRVSASSFDVTIEIGDRSFDFHADNPMNDIELEVAVQDSIGHNGI